MEFDVCFFRSQAAFGSSAPKRGAVQWSSKRGARPTSREHVATPSQCVTTVNGGASTKRYSIFTPFLRFLYDFPPSVCHTPQRQGRRHLSLPTYDSRDASRFRRLPHQPAHTSVPTARGVGWAGESKVHACGIPERYTRRESA